MQCNCSWCFCQSASKHRQVPWFCTDLQGRKQGRKHAGENLAILDRTHLHKHGTLSPESLHAESQWDQPERVGQEVHRSEMGDLIPEGHLWVTNPRQNGGRDHVAVSTVQTWGAAQNCSHLIGYNRHVWVTHSSSKYRHLGKRKANVLKKYADMQPTKEIWEKKKSKKNKNLNMTT